MSGVNLYAVLAGAIVVLGAGGFMAYQANELTGLKNEKVLLLEKVGKLESQIELSVKERVRLSAELKDYQNRKAEIEVKYITKPVTVFREVIKTVPPETVSTQANEETNALLDAINSSAVNFSLRNNPN